MTIEVLCDAEKAARAKQATGKIGPLNSFVRTYRVYRQLDKEGRILGPALLFEARDDAAAISRARAATGDENTQIWEGARPVTPRPGPEAMDKI
jgi:hypothetical protein